MEDAVGGKLVDFFLKLVFFQILLNTGKKTLGKKKATFENF